MLEYNEARALLLQQDQGLLRMKKGTGLIVTVTTGEAPESTTTATIF